MCSFIIKIYDDNNLSIIHIQHEITCEIVNNNNLSDTLDCHSFYLIVSYTLLFQITSLQPLFVQYFKQKKQGWILSNIEYDIDATDIFKNIDDPVLDTKGWQQFYTFVY